MRGKIWKELHLLKTLFVLSMVISLTIVQIASAGTVDVLLDPSPSVIPNPCSPGHGYIDFESYDDGQVIIATTITGVQFTTTGGYSWRVGDFATGRYNGKHPSGIYTSNGTKWAWLGVSQPEGRIDFTEGTANFFSLLTSTESGIALEAYNASGNLLDRAPATGVTAANAGTGKVDRLTVSAPGMKYVIVHDRGNYFLIDDICTDATGVAQIPEFPSILLPVVAALGIMLLMSRRRKG